MNSLRLFDATHAIRYYRLLIAGTLGGTLNVPEVQR